MLRKLLEMLGLAPRGSDQDKGDPLEEKLSDLGWRDSEDEESARRASGDHPGGDDLADAVYRGRPQNPLSDTF
jgi:hypothetical protein